MLAMILVRGAMVGAVYAALAVGFSMIFGVARIVNLAHTAFFMLAAYAMYTCLNLLGLNNILAIVISLVVVIGIGLLVYKVLLERIKAHEGAVILVTVALAMAFQELMLFIFGSSYKSVAPFVSGTVDIWGVTIPFQELFILGVTALCLLAIAIFLYRSYSGLAIRVTSQDREAANLMGINVDKSSMISVGIAVGLAAIAGVVVAPTYVIEPGMWGGPLIMMFAAVILGGLGSMKGSFIGAFILGYVEVIVVFLLPSGSFIKGAIALLIMVVILFIRPEGLFGVAFEEERL
jgi:branched-chain amino acid transport system permease protein